MPTTEVLDAVNGNGHKSLKEHLWSRMPTFKEATAFSVVCTLVSYFAYTTVASQEKAHERNDQLIINFRADLKERDAHESARSKANWDNWRGTVKEITTTMEKQTEAMKDATKAVQSAAAKIGGGDGPQSQ